ncbi:MAG: polyphosphate kinase 2 family protein [Microthrixaceae bacterium]
MDLDTYRIAPDQPVHLADLDPDAPAGIDKDDALDQVADATDQLSELQERLYAEGRHKVLVVLQAIDTGGKDGAIRKVFGPLNPQGVRIASFKAPTGPELAHDYLWRIHRETPGTGEIVVFNRSHYEDVLVVRVHGLVPEERWRARYRHLVEFERMLAEEGTTIVKCFLHISRDEQRERLQARVDDPTKRWKFNPGDLEERARWDDYVAAFDEMLSRTSTAYAPWYVVPANRKWFRDLVISRLLVETLRNLDPRFPEADPSIVTTQIA